MPDVKLGFALCGSFCTFAPAIAAMERCRAMGYDILPILSFNAARTDTRFGKASDHLRRIEEICGKKAVLTIAEAEPIGPKKMTDILLVAPCTGNTIAKLSNSITDTPVTMAVKSHLRNSRPVVIAVSTNDALRGSAKNIGALLNFKDYYFVPMEQDNPAGKPASLVAKFGLIPETLAAALEGRQLQPLFQEPFPR